MRPAMSLLKLQPELGIQIVENSGFWVAEIFHLHLHVVGVAPGEV